MIPPVRIRDLPDDQRRQLAADTHTPVSCTFYEMLTRLHQDAYTGQVVLHLHQGKPTVAEIPGPAEQIRLR